MQLYVYMYIDTRFFLLDAVQLYVYMYTRLQLRGGTLMRSRKQPQEPLRKRSRLRVGSSKLGNRSGRTCMQPANDRTDAVCIRRSRYGNVGGSMHAIWF